MNTEKPLRAARGEGLVRTALALALAAAVVWALTGDDGAFQGFGFGPLIG